MTTSAPEADARMGLLGVVVGDGGGAHHTGVYGEGFVMNASAKGVLIAAALTA